MADISICLFPQPFFFRMVSDLLLFDFSPSESNMAVNLRVNIPVATSVSMLGEHARPRDTTT